MRKCADMKYHFAAELRIYPSSQQKHIIAVNDGASRFVYNRMTANDRELHRLKKIAHLCPAYKGRIAYLEQARSRIYYEYGCRNDTRNIMQKKRDRNHRSRSMPGSHTYARKNTAEIFSIRSDGISQREKFANDIRKACEPQI